MDPFTAIGLASSLIEFVSISVKLISKGKEIYHSSSGTQSELSEIELLLDKTSDLHKSLRLDCLNGPDQGPGQQNAVVVLIDQCESIHQELYAVLRSLSVENSGLRWVRSFWAVVKSRQKEDHIKGLEGRLAKLYSRINDYTISDTRLQLRKIALRLDALNQAVPEQTESIKSLRNEIQLSLQKLPSTDPVNLVDMQETLTKLSQAVKELLSQSQKATTYAAQCQIIQALTFPAMNARRSDIKDAHETTLEWVYSPLEHHPSPIHFVEWLKTGGGTFWIAGKPGAGKSTLMKYIFKDPRTTELLSKWAGEDDVILVSFFFWAAGERVQRCARGLFQSLVCQILRQCPSKIPELFPAQWEQAMSSHNCTGITDFDFSLKFFVRTIDYIVTDKGLGNKFCFFIDGLDECERDGREVVSWIRRLACSSSLKFCLGSRPYNIFEDAFGQQSDRKFYLHTFTEHDIRRYVQAVLEGDPAFVSRKDDDPKVYQQLTQYICKEAQGVFLWVSLVVRQILDGLENADTMSDLQRKLRQAPTDLRALFAHILNSVDGCYHDEQARPLLVASQAGEPMDLSAYFFLGERVSVNHVLQISPEPMSYDEICRRSQNTKKRIKSRTKLLLDIVPRTVKEEGLMGHSLDQDWFGHRVTFLHRTVSDYLREPDIQSVLHARLEALFDVSGATCSALLTQIKCTPVLDTRSLSTYYTDAPWKGPFLGLIDSFMRQAKHREIINTEPLHDHLIDLERALAEIWNGCDAWWCFLLNIMEGVVDLPSFKRIAFIHLVTVCRVSNHLQWRFDNHPLQPPLNPIQLATLLTAALYPPRYLDDPNPGRPLNPTIVKVLLDQGADPNKEVFNNYSSRERVTPWLTFIQLRLADRTCRQSALEKPQSEVLEMLIRAGADPDQVLWTDLDYSINEWAESEGIDIENRGGPTARQYIQHLLLKEEAGYMLDVIKQQEQKNGPSQQIPEIEEVQSDSESPEEQSRQSIFGWLCRGWVSLMSVIG